MTAAVTSAVPWAGQPGTGIRCERRRPADILASLRARSAVPWAGQPGTGTRCERRRPADILASLRSRLAEAREQGGSDEVAGLDVSIAAAGRKLQALDQFAAHRQVTQLGMPDFRPSARRSSGAGGSR